jgi:hypothetical protein
MSSVTHRIGLGGAERARAMISGPRFRNSSRRSRHQPTPGWSAGSSSRGKPSIRIFVIIQLPRERTVRVFIFGQPWAFVSTQKLWEPMIACEDISTTNLHKWNEPCPQGCDLSMSSRNCTESEGRTSVPLSNAGQKCLATFCLFEGREVDGQTLSETAQWQIPGPPVARLGHARDC